MTVGNNLHNYCIRNDTNETLKSVVYGQRKLNNFFVLLSFNYIFLKIMFFRLATWIFFETDN